MDNQQISLGRYLYGILALEVIFSLSLTLIPFSLFVRLSICLIAILGLVIHHKLFPKIDAPTIIWLFTTIGYVLTISIFYKEPGIDIANIIALLFSVVGSAIVGYLFGAHDKFKLYPLKTLFLTMFIFGIINLFYTLYSFGIFYTVTRTGSVRSLAKMLIGTSFTNVNIGVFGYILVMLASGLNVLWCYKDQEKDNLFYFALASGILGIAGLIFLPYVKGLIAFILAAIIILAIHFLPKQKNQRIIYLSVIAGVIVVGIVAVLIVFRNQARVVAALDILSNLFKYPLGRNDIANNTCNIFLDAAYQGGIIPLLFLIGVFGALFNQLYQYYYHSEDNKMVKECLLALVICYFVYVNFNYREKLFPDYGDLVPCYLDPTFLLMMIVYGYMKAKSTPKLVTEEENMSLEGEQKYE